ncbi:hypothetical protein DPEC_G00221160 [Dallia pectoralis]|uniref:Uncharacterized protein n=1 Tax=Dallia pectoralis TaxID=75939 RepID=A0ACC2G3Z7_DALPE|nr:hypothetical protein DPEC_G00221160 [Dallia pectoralis]
MLTDPELIAAAILVPKFKTCWTSDECVLKLGLDYIKSHLKEQVVVMTEGGDTYHSSEEEDFFSAIKESRSQENTKQLETYLGCPGNRCRGDSPALACITRSSADTSPAADPPRLCRIDCTEMKLNPGQASLQSFRLHPFSVSSAMRAWA